MSAAPVPIVRTFGCVALAALVWSAAPGPDVQRAGLGLFVLIGALWMTQALPLAVTALLVPVLAALAGVLEVREAFRSFAHPVIFLFLGGLALAAALQRHGLDRALALAILGLSGASRARAALLLFALTAGLSMWISNTAAAALMLPLALGLLARSDGAPPDVRQATFLLLGLAYSASLGGIATLVGSPPNAIAAAHAGIGFAQWMAIGLPVSLLMLVAMVAVLYLTLRPPLDGEFAVERTRFEWTAGRRRVVTIFALTVLCWIGGAPLGRWLGVGADLDSLVAVAALVALVATGTLGWDDLQARVNWGVLLLFGGGLALSEAMGASGASRFLADALIEQLHGAPPILVIAAVVAFVIFLTELVSNTAAAALLVPIFAGVGAALGLPPALLAVAIAIAASCAFMLPVATPPNALVYATERVPQTTMMRCGLLLNCAAIALITPLVVWLA
jgi:sodium-dependent dicarboxylate transporter 2/3/5